MDARSATDEARHSPSLPAIGASLGIGALWGVANLGVVAASGWPTLEGALATNIVAFAAAGALMALTVSLILALVGSADRRYQVAWSLGATCAVWIAFVAAGAALGTVQPERYHLVWPELLRGGAAVAVLGVLLGLARRG